MKICKKCGAQNPDELSFCGNCGKRLETRKIQMLLSKAVCLMTVCIVASFVLGLFVGIFVGKTKSDKIIEYVDKSDTVLSTADSTVSPTAQVVESSNNQIAEEEYIADWIDNDLPFVIENDDSRGEINKVSIKKYNNDYVIIVDFKYTNTSTDAKNLINDWNVKPILYQSGIDLETPDTTSAKDIFDYSDSFRNIKDGATIETQLVWVLRNTTDPIEFEFGSYGNRDKFTKKVNIKK